MTVREYIGARYVPLFMGEWDDTVTYEPLSIVQHEGNSYTSRQFVPVGIDIDNDVYWAETGNFNSQVEQYRQEVLAVQNSVNGIEAALPISDFSSDNTVDDRFDVIEADNWVTESRIADSAVTSGKIADNAVDSSKIADGNVTADKLNSDSVTTPKIADGNVTFDKLAQNVKDRFPAERHAIYIGNSYTSGVGSTSGSDGLFNLTKDIFDSAAAYTGGGYGFMTYSGHNYTFANLIDQAFADTDDPSIITDVIFISAVGDARYCNVNGSGSWNTLAQTVKTTVAYAKQKFPNAKVWIYQADVMSTIYESKAAQDDYGHTWIDACRVNLAFKDYQNDYTYIGFGGWNLWHRPAYGTGGSYMNDLNHPNDTGYALLANMLRDGLVYGKSVIEAVYEGTGNVLFQNLTSESQGNVGYQFRTTTEGSTVKLGLINQNITTGDNLKFSQINKNNNVPAFIVGNIDAANFIMSASGAGRANFAPHFETDSGNFNITTQSTITANGVIVGNFEFFVY